MFFFIKFQSLTNNTLLLVENLKAFEQVFNILAITITQKLNRFKKYIFLIVNFLKIVFLLFLNS